MYFTFRFALSLLAVSQLFELTSGYFTFRAQIPNGYQVPHPCNSQYIWRGVGHNWYKGTGSRNPFGLAWKNNGFKWDKTLCELDSDGDGKTNGEELGDPTCTWTPGTQPNRTTELSHPGICEPLNSTQCLNTNPAIDCDVICEGIKEEGVFRHTVKLSESVDVPSRKMVLKCMVFDFPADGDYHIVAMTANAVNVPVLKHFIVVGCSGDEYPETPGTVHDCYMNSQCGTDLFNWNSGDPDICLHKDAGIRVGGNIATGFKRGLLQLHLYSDSDETVQDMSGIDIFLTPNRRPNDAAVFIFGQTDLNIPPGENDYVVSGGCSSGCMAKKMSGPMNVIAAFNHMHYTGRAGQSFYIVDGKRTHYTAYDKTFGYDSIHFHSFDTPKVINPGDALNMVCHYDTTSSNRTLHMGYDTHKNEMCLSVVMYYPKDNMALSACTSFGDLDTCDLEDSNVRGCDVTKLDYGNLDNIPEYNHVLESCKPGTCLKECKMLLNRLKRHPCYSGSMRRHLLQKIEDSTVMAEEKNNMLAFWLRMSSCDKEFEKEMCEMTSSAERLSYVRFNILLVCVGLVTLYKYVI